MRNAAILGVILASFVLCGVLPAQQAAAPTPQPAAPQVAPTPPAPPAPPPVFNVPPTLFDALFRYFNVPNESAQKINALRQESMKERVAAAERIEQELDAKHSGAVLALLNDKQKADFNRISAAVKTFWAAASAADAEYSEALTRAGARMSGTWRPEDPVSLLHILPPLQGRPLTPPAVAAEYQPTLARERAKAREAAMAPQGAEDKTTPAERNLRAEKAEGEVVDKLRAEYAAKVLAALKDTPYEKPYADLVAAMSAWVAKRKVVREALLKELPAPQPGQPNPFRAPGLQSDMGMVPRRSVEIMVAFLSPTPEQQGKLQPLRMDWERDQQQLRAESDRQIDAKSAAQIAEALPEPLKGNFKRVAEAIAGYRTALAGAETAYRDAWSKARIARPFMARVPGMQIASSLPDLTGEQRQAIFRLQTECRQAVSKEFAKANEALRPQPGQGAPADPMKARAAADAAEKQIDAEYVEKVRAVLGDTPQAKSLQAVIEARAAYEAQSKALLDKLINDLKAVVGEERLLPRPMPPPPPRAQLAAPAPAGAPAPGVPVAPAPAVPAEKPAAPKAQ